MKSKYGTDNLLTDTDVQERMLKNRKISSVYTFTDGNIATSFSNSPQYNMVKNDFVIWGIRKNANGNEVPIRYHLAIDEKPKIGNIYEVFFY